MLQHCLTFVDICAHITFFFAVRLIISSILSDINADMDIYARDSCLRHRWIQRIFTCEDNSVAGGVAIHFDEKLESYHIYDHKNNVDACVVGIGSESRRVHVIGAYRSSNQSVSKLKQFVEHDLENDLGKNKRETGLRMDGRWQHRLTDPVGFSEVYINKLTTYGLEDVVNEPMKRTTAIDHIFFKKTRFGAIHSEVIDANGISDHEIIRCSMERGKEEERRGEIVRVQTDWNRFSDHLKNIDISRHMLESNPDILIESLLRDIELCRTETSPQITSTREARPMKPWFTTDMIICLRKETKCGNCTRAILTMNY